MAKKIKCKECKQEKELFSNDLCRECFFRLKDENNPKFGIIICDRCHEIKEYHGTLQGRYLCAKCFRQVYHIQNKEKHNKYHRENKKRLKENGICVWCGKEKINYLLNTQYCTNCLLKKRYSNNKSKHKHMLLGICYACGKRPLYTKTLCEYCYEEYKERYKPKDYTQELIQANIEVANYLKEKGLPYVR